jgi:hypothetical protein
MKAKMAPDLILKREMAGALELRQNASKADKKAERFPLGIDNQCLFLSKQLIDNQPIDSHRPKSHTSSDKG